MKKSYIFWFIITLMWNIETLIDLINHSFSFDLLNCFFAILGVLVFIYQTKLLIEDYTSYKKK